jgi:tetratricopeptide (TPR) repeat protein
LHKTNARAPEPALLAPDDLLQTANRLRAEGRFREAAETYGLVYERHPHGLSAYVAEVAAASLELEQLGGPARARRLFERAIAAEPGGALDIEARQGLALAARDLGDARAELAALQGLISAHPRSPAAGRARLRVRELAAKSGY